MGLMPLLFDFMKLNEVLMLRKQFSKKSTLFVDTSLYSYSPTDALLTKKDFKRSDKPVMSLDDSFHFKEVEPSFIQKRKDRNNTFLTVGLSEKQGENIKFISKSFIQGDSEKDHL
jgi:hypothetical protein